MSVTFAGIAVKSSLSAEPTIFQEDEIEAAVSLWKGRYGSRGTTTDVTKGLKDKYDWDLATAKLLAEASEPLSK